MKAKSTKSPFKDDITKELEKNVAYELANYMELNRDMSLDEIIEDFYSNTIADYNSKNKDKLVGFSINELSDSAYEIEVWYW